MTHSSDCWSLDGRPCDCGADRPHVHPDVFYAEVQRCAIAEARVAELEAILRWRRDRFEDIVDDATVLLEHDHCDTVIAPLILGIRTVAENEVRAFDAATPTASVCADKEHHVGDVPDTILVGLSGLLQVGGRRTTNVPIFADGTKVMGTVVRYVRDVPRPETALAEEVFVRGRIVQRADAQVMIQFSHGYAWVKRTDLKTLGSLDGGEPTTTPGRGPKEGPGTLSPRPEPGPSIYLVTRCYTEPERIIYGVFSTREKADAFIATESPGDRWPDWDIDEWEVDAVPTGSEGI